MKIYEYLKHLLTEISKHMAITSQTFLEDLLLWSETLPEKCRKNLNMAIGVPTESRDLFGQDTCG